MKRKAGESKACSGNSIWQKIEKCVYHPVSWHLMASKSIIVAALRNGGVSGVALKMAERHQSGEKAASRSGVASASRREHGGVMARGIGIAGVISSISEAWQHHGIA